MKKKLGALFFIIFSITFFSCEPDSEGIECVHQPDLSDVDVKIEFESLSERFLSITTTSELDTFLQKHPVIANFFLSKQQYPDEATFKKALLSKITNPHIDTLGMEVQRVFGDESNLRVEFTNAFKHMKYYYPEVKIPKIKTITTGFDQDMYISDSLIIVGLDYYLGEDAKYRPREMYDYLLDRYAPEYIVPSAMLIYGISPRFNETSLKDNTVLADMIAYGKAFYFAKHMIPCRPDNILIWYSQNEITGARENIDIIWSHFLTNEILFETSHEIKRKYIEERPKTYEIGEAAPGRIGTWLGWQIIRSYMKRNENMTLPELMSKENPQEIFNESKFRPE